MNDWQLYKNGHRIRDVVSVFLGFNLDHLIYLAMFEAEIFSRILPTTKTRLHVCSVRDF